MPNVAESWERITNWLAKNAPDAADLLQTGASPDELTALSEELSCGLPAQFVELYTAMNGTDPEGESVGLFPSVAQFDHMAYGPLAVQQIVADCQMLKETFKSNSDNDLSYDPSADLSDEEPISDGGWAPEWIPFAGNGGGDFYCLDCLTGEVFPFSHESGKSAALAHSLEAYLADLATELEAGRLEYDETYGVRRKVAV